jgi:MFS family permease
MALHSFDDVDDALDATREFLTPVDRRRWLRLALVVFFLGGTSGFPQFNAASGGSPGNGARIEGLDAELLPAIAAVVVLLVLLGLVFALVGSIMEFVFVESLRTGTVRVRAHWGRHWPRGLRLFAFRILLGLAALLVIGGVVVAALSPLLLTGDVGTGVALLLVLSPVLLLLAVLFGLAHAFTTMFVVPVMLLEDRGVLASWRRLWPTVRGEWTEFAVYAVVAWLLGIALGIAAVLVAGVVAVVLAIPFLIAGVVVWVALSGSTAALAIAAVLAAVYGLLLAVAWALVQVPVQTYLRYYALFVLGDVNPDFDAVQEARARVRSD